MMRWIVRSSIRLQFLVIVLAGVLLIVGVNQLRDMPVDVFPEFDPPLVEIQTEALGLAADEVEALVTTPLEADLLNGVAWLDRIYSESVAGLSSILLVFEPGTDPIKARQMVQERLTQAYALPNVSAPPVMLQPLSSTSRVMLVGLSSNDVSLIDMSVLAQWNIKPRLIGVPGVANVAIWGQRDWQLQVQVDPERLNEAGVTLQQIVATTGNALWASPLSYLESSTPGTAGWIDTPNQRLSILHRLPISTADNMAQVPVIDADGAMLGDVAEIVEDHQPLIGDALLSEGPGLLLVIEKFPGAHTLDVTRGVEAALEAMAPGLAGIQIDTTVFRSANYIEQAAGNLSIALVVGAALMIVILTVFFFSWRAALISVAAIAVALTAAVLVLYLRAVTFNMMILAGLVIALVIVVDEAIIDTENIGRRLRQHRQQGSEQSAASIVLEASLEMRSAVAFGLLIIVFTALPIFFLQGLSGAFFQPLAVSYVLAVVVSMVVALVVTPALSLALLGNAPAGRGQPPLIRALQAGYSRLLARVIQVPYLALTAAGVMIVIALAAIPALRLSLLPEFKDRDIRIQWEAAPGTSHPAMTRILTRACGELRAIPGVRNCGSHVGRAITGDQVVGINSGELWLSLNNVADYDATIAAVREVAAGYPGLFDVVESYHPERLDEALTGADRDLVVRVYGNDFGDLRDKAAEVRQAISEVSGVTNAEVESQLEQPQVEIEVDLAAAEQYQVKPGDVRRAVTTLISGLVVGNLYEEQKVFNVVVWGVPEIRRNITDIRNLMIDTPNGLVRLDDLAEVRIASSPVIIRRDSVSRFLDVGADVRGRDVTSVAADIETRLDKLTFPVEFRAEVLDDAVEQQAANQRVQLVAVIAMIGIFFLLQAASTSWRLAFISLLSLPVALTGGVIAAYLDGGTLSFGSVFGFLGVLAIAARSVTVMTVRFQQLQSEEHERLSQALILKGVSERVAPVLMTALATGLALLPLIVRGEIAGSEVVRPAAIVMLGGLVTSTVVNLFIVPALCLRFAPHIAPETSGKEVGAEEAGLEFA